MEATTGKVSTMNWSNVLTVIRFFLAICVPILLFRDELWLQLVGGLTFTIGALTDYYDGYWARRYGWITTFGKIADPIADKLLTLGAFTTLSLLGMFSFWILIPILIREIGITLLRFYFLYQGVAVAAVTSGKQKTTLQITAIGVSYFNYLYDLHISSIGMLGEIFDVIMLMVLVAALYQTLYSGYDFLRNNWGLLFGEE